MKKFGVGLITLLMMVSFQNCSQQKLSGKAESPSGGGGGGGGPLNLGNTDDEATGVVTQTGGPNCRNQLRTTTLPIKPVFVVDVSGSNKVKDGTNNTPGSDPDRIVRGDSIERFYNTYKAKPNFAWSFSTFAQSSANVILAMGNATSMGNAITTFRNMPDGGNTPYIAALDAAKSNIQNDTGRAANTKYIVLFMSDGLPNPSVNQATLDAKVLDVLNVLPAGSISFNAVYYGDVNPTASDRMRNMVMNVPAPHTRGNFLDTNANPTGQDFLITDLVVVPGVVCN